MHACRQCSARALQLDPPHSFRRSSRSVSASAMLHQSAHEAAAPPSKSIWRSILMALRFNRLLQKRAPSPTAEHTAASELSCHASAPPQAALGASATCQPPLPSAQPQSRFKKIALALRLASMGAGGGGGDRSRGAEAMAHQQVQQGQSGERERRAKTVAKWHKGIRGVKFINSMKMQAAERQRLLQIHHSRNSSGDAFRSMTREHLASGMRALLRRGAHLLEGCARVLRVKTEYFTNKWNWLAVSSLLAARSSLAPLPQPLPPSCPRLPCNGGYALLRPSSPHTCKHWMPACVRILLLLLPACQRRPGPWACARALLALHAARGE
jgi:hypothetical protein